VRPRTWRDRDDDCDPYDKSRKLLYRESVILAVDNGSFEVGTTREPMDAIRAFLGRLDAADLVGLYVFPTGGWITPTLLRAPLRVAPIGVDHGTGDPVGLRRVVAVVDRGSGERRVQLVHLPEVEAVAADTCDPHGGDAVDAGMLRERTGECRRELHDGETDRARVVFEARRTERREVVGPDGGAREQ